MLTLLIRIDIQIAFVEAKVTYTIKARWSGFILQMLCICLPLKCFAFPPVLVREIPSVGFNELGQSGYFHFSLPDGFESFLITVIGHQHITYVVDYLENPTGEILVQDRGENSIIIDSNRIQRVQSRFGPHRSGGSKKTASLLIQDLSSSVLPSGRWQFQVRTSKFSLPSYEKYYPQVNDPVRVKIVGKPIGRIDTPAALKLNFYFHRNQAWRAASISHESGFQEMFHEMQNIFSLAQVRLIQNSFNDLGSESEELHIFNVEDAFEQTVHDDGMNILVSNKSGVLGFSGGISGPALLAGTSSSGVVLFRRIDETPRGWALTLSHEMGHYLGLYHSGSFDSFIGDHLSDTDPTDLANLMFSHRDPKVSSVTLTPNQIRVIRSHPCMHYLE